MTDEEKAAAQAELQKMIAETVNAAITSHMKRNAPLSAEAIQKMLDERITSLKPTPTIIEEPLTAKKPKDDPALTAAQAKADELLRKLQDATDRADKAEKQRKEDQTFATLKGYLKDIRPELQEVAARDLFHSQKRVTFDESGNALFKVRRAPAPGLAEEDVEMPLQDGVEHWVKSKEAQAFLPAPAASSRAAGRGPIQESTSRRGQGGMPTWDKPATTDEEKVQRASEAEAWMLSQQRQQGT